MFKCENCNKEFECYDGILAEIIDNKVVMTSCTPFTKLTSLCNDCVKELNIIFNEE